MIRNIKYFRILIITYCMAMIFSSCNKNKPILDEKFDDNKRGWIEESTDYHGLYIDRGFYFIESRDTASSTYRTSTGPLDKSYLFAIPEKYEIESKLKLKNYELDDAHFGLLLNGASLEYSFNIHKSGLVEVLEYNYNSGIEYIVITDTSDYEFENELRLRIEIDSTNFKLFIEDYEIGHSEFSVKSWQDIRLFTSKQSKIAVDYITITELKK